MTSKDQETKREQMRVSIKLFFRAWSRTCARNSFRSTEIRKVDYKELQNLRKGGTKRLDSSRDLQRHVKEHFFPQMKARRRKTQRIKAAEDRRPEEEKELEHQYVEEARRRDKETRKW